MGQRTGGDAVVAALVAAEVEVVFGIPSVHNLPIYDALRRDGRIRTVTVRHEQGAAGAADGYARTTGRLGVCLTSTGPGAANAVGGLLEAYLSSSPVLHLTGQIDSRFLDRHRGFIHEVPDQPAMLGSVSKAHRRAGAPDEIEALVGTCATIAMAHRRGPVSLEIPIDYQYARCAAPPAVVAAGGDELEGPAESDVAAAAALVTASRRPIVWAGGGVVAADAAGEVAALVRRLGAGLLTTPNGRGVLPESDPLSIGNLSWDPEVRALCADADLLVAIGTRFQGPNTENWKMELPERLVHLDVDPTVPGRNYPVAAKVVADARAATSALLAALEDLGVPEPLAEPGWPERVAAVAGGARERLRSTLGSQVALLDGLAPLLKAGTVVVKDSTIPAYTWGNRLLPVQRPRTSIMPNGFAIGLGLPQALGAALAAEGDPVLLLAGDGGFLLAATELATVAEEQLPIVVLVFVDGGYGILRNIQDRQYGSSAGRIGVELGRPDFCGLARALGVAAERVDTVDGYVKAVRAGLEGSAPLLIEVDLDAIGPMAVPYTGTSKPPHPPA